MRLLALGLLMLFLFSMITAVSAEIPATKINSPENKAYFSTDILLNVSTNIISNITYNLNGGPQKTLYNNSLSGASIVEARQGQNTLTLIAYNGIDQKTDSKQFSVERCAIDVGGLSSKDDSVLFTLENTGSVSQDIDYSIKINLNKTHTGRETLGAGQKKQVSNPFVFKIGSYQLEISATSNCGGKDDDLASYSKTGPTDCLNPSAPHGTFRTNSTEGKTYICNNGFWKALSPFSSDDAKYCQAANRCGDGVLNCGETSKSCPADYRESLARCDCASKKFYGDTRLASPGEFFDRCKTNCTLECISDFSCQTAYECKDFHCYPKSGRCGVKIQDFDYTQQVGLNEQGYAFATIKNTGLITENITARLLIRDYLINSSWSFLNPDSAKLINFLYKSDFVGTQGIKLEAASDCGENDMKSATINVVNTTVISALSTPLDTEVNLLSEKAETNVGKEKSISFSIKTNQPQIFTIQASGVPDDWLDYPKTIGITEDRDLNIFVRPKKEGDYNITVSVSGKEKVFTRASSLHVVPELQQTLNTDFSFWPVVLFLIVVLVVVLYSGSKYLIH